MLPSYSKVYYVRVGVLQRDSE